MTKRWFCINCKEFVDTYIDILKGFSICCKKCGSMRLMKLEEMKDKEFKELVKNFRHATKKIN